MAVRNFDGTDDTIIVAPGSVDLTGGLTMACIYKKSVNSIFHALISNHSSIAAAIGSFEIRSNDVLVFSNDAATGSFSTTTVLVADGWCLLAVTKAAGTSFPRFHILKGLTGSWIHENGTITKASPATIAGGAIRFGDEQGVDDANGRMAIAAEWNYELTDSQVETLATGLMTQSWYNALPTALWEFNQTVTTNPVLDLRGDADQTSITGTTVVTGDDPPGWTFGPGPSTSPNPIHTPVGFFDPDISSLAWF